MNAADVMVSKVITVRSDTTVGKIAEILLANRISAVPVVDAEGGLVGIVSEGDLIHRIEADTERRRSWWLELITGKDALASEFIKAHARKAADVMTRSVVSVTPDTSLGELAGLLEKHRIKRVPVMQDGKLVGIVSRANLIQAIVRRGHDVIAEETVEDSTLRTKVLAQLRSKPWWPNNVYLIVKDGNVELFGVVESKIVKDAIRVAVEVTPGVRAVSDKITIEHLQAGS